MNPPRCPNCKDRLEAVSLDARTPPWVCTACARGWWNAEIKGAQHWDRQLHFFTDERVRAEVELELEQALAGEG